MNARFLIEKFRQLGKVIPIEHHENGESHIVEISLYHDLNPNIISAALEMTRCGLPLENAKTVLERIIYDGAVEAVYLNCVPDLSLFKCILKESGFRVVDVHEARHLNQFYTSPEVAQDCISRLMHQLPPVKNVIWVEPSVGSGAFFHHLPEPKIGLDIQAKIGGVIEQDFLSWSMKKSDDDFVVTIGNPPFGKNSSMAVKFFNHAAQFSDVIAFIIPRTFEKASLQNRLDPYFHCDESVVIGTNAFRMIGEDYDVPCCFQVWSKKSKKRELHDIKRNHKDFEFVDKSAADFAFQRVGVNAGKISLEFQEKSPSSHYFIKTKIGMMLFEHMSSIDWSEVKQKTAGNPSISKHELIEAYANLLKRKLA